MFHWFHSPSKVEKGKITRQESSAPNPIKKTPVQVATQTPPPHAHASPTPHHTTMFPSAEVTHGRALLASADGRVALRGRRHITVVRRPWALLQLAPHKASARESCASLPEEAGARDAKDKDKDPTGTTAGERERFLDIAWSPPGLGRCGECLLAGVTSHSRPFVYGPPPDISPQWGVWGDLTIIRHKRVRRRACTRPRTQPRIQPCAGPHSHPRIHAPAAPDTTPPTPRCP